MSDSIVERPAGAFTAPVEPPKPAKVSKFKMGRTVQQMPAQSPAQQSEPVSSPPPSGPAGRTLADSITEHQASSSTPQAPDEFDPAVIHREIEADYHKARNKFIQQQGGFKQAPEDEELVLENEDGTTKKVSRFMAARMKSSGL
jgi:unconventional prefoldin RPB5 interactor 1